VEGRLQAATEDMHRQEMFCHHAEQEVKRVEAIIEVRGSSIACCCQSIMTVR
jgi:hypothetical protein